MYEFAKSESRLHTRGSRPCINLNAFHPRNVDNERAVADRETVNTMPPAADSDRQTHTSGEVNSRADVIGIGAIHNQGGVSIDPAVPHAARLFIAGIIRTNYFASQMPLQRPEGGRS